jgi:hypothetical protein
VGKQSTPTPPDPAATAAALALRAGAQSDDGCEASGQSIPFPRTKADRLASGDPRLSIEERYGNVETYVSLLQKAIDTLSRQGFLLPVDAETALNKSLNNVLSNSLLPKK